MLHRRGGYHPPKQTVMIRKQIRIKEYDYSQQGIYFVTICSYQKKNIFCSIDKTIQSINYDDIEFDKYIQLTNIGCILNNGIHKIKDIYQNVNIIEYTIMPNHVHIMLEFIDIPQNLNGNTNLSKIIGSLKRFVTKEYNKNNKGKTEI